MVRRLDIRRGHWRVPLVRGRELDGAIALPRGGSVASAYRVEVDKGHDEGVYEECDAMRAREDELTFGRVLSEECRRT